MNSEYKFIVASMRRPMSRGKRGCLHFFLFFILDDLLTRFTPIVRRLDPLSRPHKFLWQPALWDLWKEFSSFQAAVEKRVAMAFPSAAARSTALLNQPVALSLGSALPTASLLGLSFSPAFRQASIRTVDHPLSGWVHEDVRLRLVLQSTPRSPLRVEPRYAVTRTRQWSGGKCRSLKLRSEIFLPRS